jgi:hypothetical protein
MEEMKTGPALERSREILDSLKEYLESDGPEGEELEFVNTSIEEVEKAVLQLEAEKKMDSIAAFGFIAEPHLDEELAQVLKEGGGGWATKLPNGDGYVIVHVIEADLDLYRTVCAEEKSRETLRYRINDGKVEPDGSQFGLVTYVTFHNRSNAPFSYDRTHYGMDAGFRFRNMRDGDWFVSMYPRSRKLAESSEMFSRTLTLGPGQTEKKIFMFSPKTRDPTFFSDIMGGHYTIRHWFPEGKIMGIDKPQRPPEFKCPFFSLDPPTDTGHARLLVEVWNNPTQYDRPKENYLYWALQTGFGIYNRELDVVFELDKYVFIPLSSHPDVIFKKKLWMTAKEPGVKFNIDQGIKWDKYTGGWNRMPHEYHFSNPDPATGGRDPPEVPPLVLYEPKEGEEGVVVKEEDMDDPVSTYCQWVLTHTDPEYRKFAGLRLGELGDIRAAEPLIQARDDKVLEVKIALGNAFRKLTGMNMDVWLKKEKQKRAEQDKFRDIALKHARVTNINIKDSVIQRSNITIEGDAGEMTIDDSIVSRSDIKSEGDKQAPVVIKDSVVHKSEIGTVDTTPPPPPTEPKDPDQPPQPVSQQDGSQQQASPDGLAQYEAALTQALADGVVNPLEDRLLGQLRERFGISMDEHDMLMAMKKTTKGDG